MAGGRSIGAGNKSITLGRSREELAAQFVAEFPVDDDVPSYAEGSREATLLKIFGLLDGHRGYIEVPEWKEYVLAVGLTTEDLARELASILAEAGRGGAGPDGAGPRIIARQWVGAMAAMVAGWGDPEFARLVAASLSMVRKRQTSQQEREEQPDEEPAAED